MKIFLTIMLSAIIPMCGLAQSPWFLKDINQTGTKSGALFGNPSNPSGVSTKYELGNLAIFIANDSVHGNELWRSDGTDTGTYLLQDITPGSANILFTSGMFRVGSLLYFSLANVSGAPIALWRTDGTPSGTFRIMSDSGRQFSSYLTTMNYVPKSAAMANYFYFISTDSLSPIVYNSTNYPNRRSRVYKSDGTIAGTSMYYDAGFVWQGYATPTVTSYGEVYSLGVSGSNLYISARISATAANITSASGASLPVLLRGDGSNPPLTLYAPGTNGVWFNSTADIAGSYFLFSGYSGSNTGLFRLKATESVPVLLDTVSTTGNTTNSINLHPGSAYSQFANRTTAIGNRFFYRSHPGAIAVTTGELAGTFKITGTIANTQYLPIGSASGKIILGTNNAGKIYFWDGVSPASYSSVSDSLTPYATWAAFEANNKLFFTTTSLLWTSELDGSNCVLVYPLIQGYNFALLSNGNYFGYTSSKQFINDFDGGFEPALIKTRLKVFIGATSNDWNSASNWSPAGIPADSDDVVIPRLATARMPVVAINASCHNLMICQSSLSISSPAMLTVKGYFAQYQASVTGGGILNFAGTGIQKLYGYPSSFFNNAGIAITGSLGAGSTNATITAPIALASNAKVTVPFTSLTLTKSPFVTGFGRNSYVILGKGQTITYTNAGSTSTQDSVITFPVGTNDTSYTPMQVTYNKSNVASLSLSINDSVINPSFAGGRLTWGAINKTWTLAATGIASNGPIPVQLGWSNSAEALSGFKSGAAYVARMSSSGVINGAPQSAVTTAGVFYVSTLVRADSLSGQYFIGSDTSFVPTAVPAFAYGQDFRVYPNPAIRYILVQGTGLKGAVLTDMLGRTLRSYPASTVQHSGNECYLPVDGLQPGSYILILQTAKTSVSKQITIQ